ncbi:hypothetical protein Xen7305DRAFT_00023070 [Xenococcus sp. PCC 7305]|uniref:hypothetical protein n=1 Tax=Xenococcus sp. PCC 7305 TaxID=102125 RepID=UPI0002AD15B6|nr:hypothetical protein [Xenococcus sp. PCC 7305]ELS02591.1 hypothetical protein Xen7305DRAFT_00023070 [Xenococcus sp. PCC 7305]
MKNIFSYLLAIALSFGLVSCGDLNNISDRIKAFPIPDIKNLSFDNFPDSPINLSEAAPPILIRKLDQAIDSDKPQVSILSPSPDKVLEDTNVAVQLKVTDFSLFKAEDLEMGPHLHLILDNEPYQAIYNIEEPIVLENLPPGTHTLRVFAVRPWHEGFKNQGAYAETTFHVLTQTQENNPDPQIPLLTYSSPNGTYGAEPIMLDFYLSHLSREAIVNNSSPRQVPSWRVRATVNGESFILDQWQPVYLTGFEIGNNWIQLELLDDEGNSIDNTFNNTVRLISYDPENADNQDTLAKITTGEIDLQNVMSIVDPNYEQALEKNIQEVSEEISSEETADQSEFNQEDSITVDIVDDSKVLIEEITEQETVVEGESESATEEPIAQNKPETDEEDQDKLKLLLETNEIQEEAKELEITTEIFDISETGVDAKSQVTLEKPKTLVEEAEEKVETIPENPTTERKKIVEPEIHPDKGIPNKDLKVNQTGLQLEEELTPESLEQSLEAGNTEAAAQGISQIKTIESPEINNSGAIKDKAIVEDILLDIPESSENQSIKEIEPTSEIEEVPSEEPTKAQNIVEESQKQIKVSIPNQTPEDRNIIEIIKSKFQYLVNYIKGYLETYLNNNK